MKALKAYFKGWSSVVQYKRLTLILYIVNFVLALLSAVPVAGFLGNSIGHSTALSNSLPGFDYTFIGEMQQRFGDQINAILDQTIWFVILYFIISIFLMGGILSIFKNQPDRFHLKIFWQGASKYFWRITRLTIYFLIVQIFLLIFFFSILSAMNNGLNPFAMESEEQLINSLLILGPIYIFCVSIVFLIQDYAKVDMVHENPDWLMTNFWGSFKKVFQNFGSFFFLFILNSFTLALAFLIYWSLSDQIVPDTMSSIMLLFFIGQVFIILRIIIKILNLGSITHLYQWTRANT